MAHQKKPTVEEGEDKLPPATTGNASNPSPNSDAALPAGPSQLLGKEAEKYIRESASIEDLPDAQDEEDMDNTLRKETDPS